MAKAAFKARRLRIDRQPAWAIAWYHWCRQSARGFDRVRWLSRYVMTVRFDEEIVSTHSVYIRCATCFAHRQVGKGELPIVWVESAVTVQLLEAGRCASHEGT